jgi:hypothetical protein
MPCPNKAATATSGSSGFCGWKSITVHWNTLCLGILIHSINPHAISAILIYRNFLVHISQWKPWDPLQGWYILLAQDMSTKSQKPRDPFTPLKPLVVHVVMETRWLHKFFQGPPISHSPYRRPNHAKYVVTGLIFHCEVWNTWQSKASALVLPRRFCFFTFGWSRRLTEESTK